MPQAPEELPDAELALLQELWQRPSATVRELTETLYGNTARSLLATVQKLLDRLEGKDCVERDRSCWPHKYKAALQREQFIRSSLQATADKVCEGDLAPLLTNLVRSSNLTAKDRNSLRKLLDELDEQGRKKS
jgi:predicted transcriptional regulator